MGTPKRYETVNNHTLKGIHKLLSKKVKRKCFFLEVPISFKPRRSEDGKKITITEGIKCLFFVIFNKLYKS